jgi:hypothetical protein
MGILCGMQETPFCWLIQPSTEMDNLFVRERRMNFPALPSFSLRLL